MTITKSEVTMRTFISLVIVLCAMTNAEDVPPEVRKIIDHEYWRILQNFETMAQVGALEKDAKRSDFSLGEPFKAYFLNIDLDSDTIPAESTTVSASIVHYCSTYIVPVLNKDKIVRNTARRILEALFEPLFRDCSHAYRPNRSARRAPQV
ncbi:MAG: hypothetical protein GF344_00465 [Chitinivibrionales bacterium]|nr:hypothetical protein [Chitinivibrionales bacterium]MBD3355598.1 hypothetical protein [Chitinivibrionales bacterium]